VIDAAIALAYHRNKLPRLTTPSCAVAHANDTSIWSRAENSANGFAHLRLPRKHHVALHDFLDRRGPGILAENIPSTSFPKEMPSNLPSRSTTGAELIRNFKKDSAASPAVASAGNDATSHSSPGEAETP